MPDIRESLIRILGFARKELMGILRQPRLVVILIMGPFLILLLFGIGYTNTERTRTTLIVLPEDSVLYDQIDAMTQRFSGINFAGIVSDGAAADEALFAGEVDLLMIAPGDPMQDVREGRRAVI